MRLAAEAHAGELAKVSGARDVRVVERALPAPLAERPAASFLWPLGKEPIFRHDDSAYENPMDRRERTPNVLRSKFLDDERLIRPMLEEEMRKAQQKTMRDQTRLSTNTLETISSYANKPAENTQPSDKPSDNEPKKAEPKKAEPKKEEPKKAEKAPTEPPRDRS